MQGNAPLHIVGEAVTVLIPLVLCLTVHEFAHAWAARRLGDDTAERMGRLTLNPLAHADPIGTVFLPLVILVANGAAAGAGAGMLPFFGWARPTPVNAGRFTRKLSVRTGSGLVAAAGPLSNILLALICALALTGVLRTPGISLDAARASTHLLVMMIYMNAGLAVFNLLPLYPLDGETIVQSFMRTETAVRFAHFNQTWGRWILLGLVFLPQSRELLRVPVAMLAQGILTLTGLT